MVDVIKMDEMFDELFRIDDDFSFGVGPRHRERGKGNRWNFDLPNFPPVDLKTDNDKNLYFDFALAGYSRNEIDISFEGDWMVLTITPIAKDMSKNGDYTYLHRGIRKSSTKVKYYVPRDKYQTENSKASFENGLLNITIPSKEPEKAKKLEIE